MLSRLTACLALLLLIPSMTVFSESATKDIVTAEAMLSQNALHAGGDFKLAVKVRVRDGFHIGSATVKDPGIPSKLAIKPAPGVKFDAPVYPAAKMIAFGFAGGEKLSVYDGAFTIFVTGHVAKDVKLGDRVLSAVFSYQACNDTTCTMPAKVPITVKARIIGPGEKVSTANTDVTPSDKPSAGSQSRVDAIFGRGAIFGFAMMYLLGLGLCFTPCVYPMVPVTLGYFGMQSEKRTGRVAFLAACYVLGIATTYSALGVVAARTGGVFGAALQNPYIPVGIAAILIVLALSMFGLYELKPPNWIASRAQGRSGPVGALLMGLVFGIVAAPCVGPVTVSLLVYVAKVGKPVFGFFTFFMLALGMGTPLFFLAMFSGAIHRIPQAGMWMVTVRKVFGLLLIGAATYFVTPIVRTQFSDKYADTLLPLVIMLSGFYIGWLEPSLRKVPKLKSARKMTGVVLLAIGLFNMPSARVPTQSINFAPYSDTALAKAASDGLPVMIDFTADWCTYCKEIEHKTFPNPSVKKESKRFVLLKADVTNDGNAEIQALIKKYRVPGPPTILFFDSSGKELPAARSIGFVSADQLVKLMRMAK